LRFGINTFCHPNTPGIIQLAEESGFDLATIVEGQLLWRDIYCYLSICAQNTSKIRLGPGMTNPLTRHPSVTAGAIATLNELSNGRGVLGIGRGNNALATIGYPKASLQRLREYVEALRGYWKGEIGVPFRGKRSTVRFWNKCGSQVLIIAQGPRSLELAGEVGDGVIILSPRNPKWSSGHCDM